MSETPYSGTGFTLRRVISRTLGLLRRHFGTVALLSLLAGAVSIPITYGLLALMQVLLPPYLYGRGLEVIIGILRSNLEAVIPSAFLVGGLTSLAFDEGETRPTLGQSFRNAFRFMLPLVLIKGSIALAVSVGYLLLIVPGVFLYLMWFVALPVRVIEGPGWRNAFSRSAALTKGHRWEVFGIVAVLYLALLVTSVPATVIAFLAPRLIEAEYSPVLIGLIWISSSVSGALYAVGRAVTYTELSRATTGGLLSQVTAVFE